MSHHSRPSGVATRQIKDKNVKIPILEEITVKSKFGNTDTKNSKFDESKEAKIISPPNEPVRHIETNNSLPMNEELPYNDFTVKNFGKKDYVNENSTIRQEQRLDKEILFKETLFKDDHLPMAFSNPSEFTEENKKLMFDTLKFFYSIHNQNNGNMTIKNNDLDKMKLIEELRDKIDIVEKENFFLKKSFEEKENFYLEKIKILESQIQNSSKNDIINLQKQNKEYEEQVAALNKKIQLMNKSHDNEKEKFNSVVTEIMTLKVKLAEDINGIEQLRNDLLSQQEATEKQGQKDDKDKISIVLKYDKNQDKNTLPYENEINISQANRTVSINNSNPNLHQSGSKLAARSNLSIRQSNKNMKVQEETINLRRNTTEQDNI